MPEKALLLSSSIKSIKGIGANRADAFSTINIFTVLDLISYYPRKYLDRSTVLSISKLNVNDDATIIGKVEAAEMRIGKRRQYFQAVLSDGKGMITLTWFNGARYIKKSITIGDRLAVSGKVDFFNGHQMVHPEYEKLKNDEDPVNSGKIIPLYSMSSELNKAGIDSRSIRRMIKIIFNDLKLIPDHFSDNLKKDLKLISLDEALRNIHFSESDNKLKEATNRLKFDEHFFLQLLMAIRKSSYQRIETKALKKIGPKFKILSESLDFELTNAQKKVIKEIKTDLAQPFSMNRLLQGDVGSGKTIVSILATTIAVANEAQVAIMVPTEILARQHFESFKKHSEISHMTCALLVGGTRAKERVNILNALEKGQINIIIGTHALIQKDIIFKSLGFCIIDEQHRFGVSQRAELISKGSNPHVLAMTATPIPRTLAITYHGDMDLSIIDEMPKNRIPVVTKIVNEPRMTKVYKFLKDEVSKERQCMIVYPLVKESEKSDLAAAVEMYSYLSENVFSGLVVGLLHGKMKKEEKDEVMSNFKQNKINILISTTVIEVGIDIPNATVMLIEHAERFGLTQLHQLRGRVGRGSEKSYCILVHRKITQNSKKRLKIMESTNDGFKISDEDLKIRGPGEFFGIRQSGFLKYKIANMVTDGPILRSAREAAISLVKRDATLSHQEHNLIRNRLVEEYREKLQKINLS